MSEVEIPEDVLERAAQAARLAYHSVPALSEGLLLPRWETVVKAVAWTLDDENAVVLAKCDERDALQARVEELEAANAAVEEENDLLRDVIQQKHARVEVLTAALDGLVGAVSDPAVMCFGTEITRARAALAAGETESAPLPLNESGEVPLSYFSKPGETESEDVLLDQIRSLDAQRAALLVRLREEQPPWVFCTCGHSPHKHGTDGVPPALGSHCYAGEDVNDAYSNCSCKGYAPTESEAP